MFDASPLKGIGYMIIAPAPEEKGVRIFFSRSLFEYFQGLPVPAAVPGEDQGEVAALLEVVVNHPEKGAVRQTDHVEAGIGVGEGGIAYP